MLRAKSRIATITIGAISAVALFLAAGPRAVADTDPGPRPPAGWLYGDDLYTGIFGSAGEWAPRGTVIVDSGFRPYPNGFPFANWGASLEDNQIIYGVPSRYPLPPPPGYEPAKELPLNSLAMRRSFGDGVCQDRKKIDPTTGSCDMTATAEIMARALQAQAQGGHCFGLAAAAAALYNGQLPPNQLGSGAVLSVNRLTPPAQQTINRLFISQYMGATKNVNQNTTPDDMVRNLIADLAGGTVPYVLGVSGPGGGHAITPYAVYDRGAGQFDIAVYDNNWPNQPRAVHVDLVANTFEYSGSTNPADKTLLWSTADDGALYLIPVADTLGDLTCPICKGPDQGTLVAFSAVKAENADIEIEFQSLSGEPLPSDMVNALEPLSPPTESQVGFPVFVVAPGIEFRVVVDTDDAVSRQSLEIYAMSRGTSRYVEAVNVKPGTTQAFMVADHANAFASNAPSSPRLLQTIESTKRSIVMNGHLISQRSGTVADQNWSPKLRTMTYASDSQRATLWNIQADRSSTTQDTSFVALDVSVPAGAKVVVKYDEWSKVEGPASWIDEKGDGTLDRRVVMQPVTPELIKEHKRDIYFEQGVG